MHFIRDGTVTKIKGGESDTSQLSSVLIGSGKHSWGLQPTVQGSEQQDGTPCLATPSCACSSFMKEENCETTKVGFLF